MMLSQVIRTLVFFLGSYVIVASTVILTRHMQTQKVPAHKMLHILCFSIFVLLAEIAFMVTISQRWNDPMGIRTTTILAANLWAIIGLHVLKSKEKL